MTKRARRNGEVTDYVCESWSDVEAALEATGVVKLLEAPSIWFRGVADATWGLSPSLMRDTAGLSVADHDQMEEDLFFEFQARASELRAKSLTDWEYLFFGRHFGVPTRVMDWTDTFGVALYFALEEWRQPTVEPAIWILKPDELNEQTWGVSDVILPKYLGYQENGEFWDYGDLISSDGDWAWNGPVAIYPIQINERVRAQRGWFTIHGNDRAPLDEQYPGSLSRLRLRAGCIPGAQRFLELAGFNRFSIYPDLENLARWIRDKNKAWASARLASGTSASVRISTAPKRPRPRNGR